MPSYHIFFSPVEFFVLGCRINLHGRLRFVPVIAYAVSMSTSASLLLVKVRWAVEGAISESGIEMPNLFAIDMLTFIFGVAGHILLFWLVTWCLCRIGRVVFRLNASWASCRILSNLILDSGSVGRCQYFTDDVLYAGAF